MPPPILGITWNTLTGSSNTQGAIARWLNKSSLTSGPGGDADMILQETQGWIYTRLRHWQMLTAPIKATMTVGALGSSGSDQIAVPADMIEPDFFMIAGMANGSLYQQELTQKQPNDVYRAWTFDGSGNRIQQLPKLYSFNQNFLQLDSQPDLAYPYFYTYYQFPLILSLGNPSNFLTQFYPRLLRNVCMMMGAEWTKESNQGPYDRTYWEQQSIQELGEVQAQSDRARRASVNTPSFPGDVPGYAPYGAIVSW